ADRPLAPGQGRTAGGLPRHPREPQSRLRHSHHRCDRGLGVLLRRQQPPGSPGAGRPPQAECKTGAGRDPQGSPRPPMIEAVRVARHRGVLLAFVLLLPGCGGSGGGGTPSPSPSPSAPPAIANPCTAALAAGGDVLPVVARSAASTKSHGGLGVDKRDPREHLWAHRLAALEGRVEARDVRAAAPPDVGDIAVIPDDGSLIISPNPFDLAGRGLRFQPNATGGYDVSRADASFRPNLGPRRTLADDDTLQAPIPFAFPFYGTPRTTAFVNSDGNITFTRGDTATDERGLA